MDINTEVSWEIDAIQITILASTENIVSSLTLLCDCI